MRAAAILGLGCSPKTLKPFQFDEGIEWRIGMPGPDDGVDVILLFGGDGTIHRHLGQLVKLGLPVLVVPAGSGNDFARALGMRGVRNSLAAWRKFCGGAANVRTIDLGVITPLDAEPPIATSAAWRAWDSMVKFHGGPIDCRDGCADTAGMCSAWRRRFLLLLRCL